MIAVVALGLVAAIARRRRPVRVRGRTVLVAGGSRGLGLSLARRFAQLGAEVAICARDEQELARAADRLAPLGPTARAVVERASGGHNQPSLPAPAAPA